MSNKLVLYRCGWSATPNEVFYTIHHPPVPALLKYWYTGGGETHDNYVGLVAVPEGVDPMTVIRQEFHDVIDRGMTTVYSLLGVTSDRFQISPGDWDAQRLAYFAATGQLLDKPVVGHYMQSPESSRWWCTTNIEIFDV